MRPFVLLILLCGCGRTETYRFTRVFDAAEPFVDAGAGRDAGTPDAGFINPAVCDVATAPFKMLMPCRTPVHVVSITPSMAACFVDVTAKAGQDGMLVWDCMTDGGRAEIRFPGGTFVGSTVPPFVAVCTGTSFPWSDGCFWRSAQRIQGIALANRSLVFSYVERPDELQCASPCSATGNVRVEP